MELAFITLSISLIVFFAYLFSSIFKRYQIPDVLFLLTIGLVLGPITKTINVDQFGILGDIFAAITLTIILFESGINIKIKEILSTAPRAVLLMLLTLIFSVIVVIPFGVFFFDLSLIESILVGLVVGGVSAGISTPISKKLPITEKTQTILALETNMNDVLSISLFIAFLQLLNGGVFDLEKFSLSLSSLFFFSVGIGMVIAVIWSQLIKNIRGIENNIFMTPALVLMIYSAAELLEMSGMMAVFAFAITLGNLQYVESEKLPRFIKFEEFNLTGWEKTVFSSFVFLLKTYFFIYIGLSIEMDNLLIILMGALVTILLFGARFLAVKLSVEKEMPAFDKEVLMKLVPKGLVGAALITLVDNQMIQDFAYSIILFSIVFTSILLFLMPNKKEKVKEEVAEEVIEVN